MMNETHLTVTQLQGIMREKIDGIKNTKPAVYEAWRNGEITDQQAKNYFGYEREVVKQMKEIEEILSNQEEPDIDDGDLLKND